MTLGDAAKNSPENAPEESAEWQQLAEWFEACLAQPPEQREALVRNAPITQAMRNELTSLLAHAPRASRFFDALQQAVGDAPSESDSGRTFDGGIGDTAEDTTATMVGRDVGHYRITAELGRGGMGVVYRATDLRLQRTVALKLLRTRPVVQGVNSATFDSGAVATGMAAAEERAKRKLLAEARASASLDHPNICTVYEVGETDDHAPFIAMAYYAGETLDARLRRGPLPVSAAADIAAQIASGLCAAHERGIVHRDVKPANVLVTAQGVVKLLDFGIARDLTGNGPRTTPRGFTPGTASYMSPEQISGHHVDHRTDLWSLGIVLYEMCAGTRPFAASHIGGMLYDIAYTPAPPLPNVPAHVQRIVSRLLEKDPAQRYQRADDVVHDLMQRVEASAEAVPASSVGWLGRVMRRIGLR